MKRTQTEDDGWRAKVADAVRAKDYERALREARGHEKSIIFDAALPPIQCSLRMSPPEHGQWNTQEVYFDPKDAATFSRELADFLLVLSKDGLTVTFEGKPAPSIFMAVALDDGRMVDDLVKLGADPNGVDAKGRSALLSAACVANHRRDPSRRCAVEALVAQGARYAGCGPAGGNPMHWILMSAAEVGNVEQHLMLGASLEGIDLDQKTVLHRLARRSFELTYGKRSAVRSEGDLRKFARRAVQAGVDINARDGCGEVALVETFPDPFLFKLFMEMGADLREVTKFKGTAVRAMCTAFEHDNVDAVRAVLDGWNGEDLEAVYCRGNGVSCMLVTAIVHGATGCLDLMTERGFDLAPAIVEALELETQAKPEIRKSILWALENRIDLERSLWSEGDAESLTLFEILDEGIYSGDDELMGALQAARARDRLDSELGRANRSPAIKAKVAM